MAYIVQLKMTWTANSALFLRLTIAFSVITTAAVAIRLIGRHLVKINYGIEDIFITVAFLLLIGLNVNGQLRLSCSRLDANARQLATYT